MGLPINQEGLEDRINRKVGKVPKRRIAKQLIASALSALASVGAYEASLPKEASACMGVYNPSNSFYDKHIRSISSNPEDLKSFGSIAFVRVWVPDGIENIMSWLNNQERSTPHEYFPDLYGPKGKYDPPNTKGKVKLHPHFGSALIDIHNLRNLPQSVIIDKLNNTSNLADIPNTYVIEFEVKPVIMPTIGIKALEPVITQIYDSRGHPLGIGAEIPQLTIFPPGHFSKWAENCRTSYSIRKK